MGWHQATSRGVCEGDDVICKLPNRHQTLRAPSELPFRPEHLVCGVAQRSPSQNAVFKG